jgi:hypothetical protein
MTQFLSNLAIAKIPERGSVVFMLRSSVSGMFTVHMRVSSTDGPHGELIFGLMKINILSGLVSVGLLYYASKEVMNFKVFSND